MKKINFRQTKYMLPAVLYLPLLVAGYAIIDLFSVEIKDTKDNGLKTTEYLNSELPAANIREDLGSKRQNVQDMFGSNLIDHTAVDDIENDIDSIRKKEDYESKYTEEELQNLQEQKNENDEIKRLREMNKKLQEAIRKGQGGSEDLFSDSSLTDEERSALSGARKNDLYAELERDLNRTRRKTDPIYVENTDVSPDLESDTLSMSERRKAVKALDEDESVSEVVKKVNIGSQYFNTVEKNENESAVISAIIDEEIKVVEGSRVRLRLLDDVELGDVTVKKGTYLYAIMSGFNQYRIQGTVSSVMVNDEIHKINLSIYDTDGLEGLYVPGSAFRETVKDVASSAMQSNMNMNMGYNTNSLNQWAMQGLQNTYQRTTNAIAKAIKKNKVRIKYGTQVYLINGKDRANTSNKNNK